MGTSRLAQQRTPQDDRSYARRTGRDRYLMAAALITGASSGLGEEFALQLARAKRELVLVARREDRLRDVADRAKKAGAPRATIICSNLGRIDAAHEIHRQVTSAGIAVDYLVNNAGFGTHGNFAQVPLDREIEQINLNVSALVALTRLFLPGMVDAQRGYIINVASTAAFQPVPWMATYAATKPFALGPRAPSSSRSQGSRAPVFRPSPTWMRQPWCGRGLTQPGAEKPLGSTALLIR